MPQDFAVKEDVDVDDHVRYLAFFLPTHFKETKPINHVRIVQGVFVQILFPLRGERISNLIDFSREFSPIAGWEILFFPSTGQSLVTPRYFRVYVAVRIYVSPKPQEYVKCKLLSDTFDVYLPTDFKRTEPITPGRIFKVLRCS